MVDSLGGKHSARSAGRAIRRTPKWNLVSTSRAWLYLQGTTGGVEISTAALTNLLVHVETFVTGFLPRFSQKVKSARSVKGTGLLKPITFGSKDIMIAGETSTLAAISRMYSQGESFPSGKKSLE